MKKNLILCLAMTMLTGCVTAQDIQLPEPDKSAKMTLMETLQKRASSREFSDKEVSDAVLSQVLWAACGINRPEEDNSSFGNQRAGHTGICGTQRRCLSLSAGDKHAEESV